MAYLEKVLWYVFFFQMMHALHAGVTNGRVKQKFSPINFKGITFSSSFYAKLSRCRLDSLALTNIEKGQNIVVSPQCSLEFTSWYLLLIYKFVIL